MPRDPMHTRLCEQYGCEVPIVAFSHTRDVVAAVSNAGAIGVLGGGRTEPEDLRTQIRWIRDRIGDKPFGVDLLMPASFVEGNLEELEARIPEEHRQFIARLKAEHGIPEPRGPLPVSHVGLVERTRRCIEVLFEEQVPIFASGLGSPAFLVERAHRQGMKVWGLVGLPRQAQRHLEAGLDAIVAQGYDAGGHSGRIGTFSLVPEVLELAAGSDTLVLAAGGVSRGRHVAAALAMGADGVWTGTIWQATHESEIDMHLKQRLVDGTVEDGVQSRATTGKPSRALRSRWSEVWEEPGAPEPLPMPLQGLLVTPLLTAIHESRMEEWMRTPAGQGSTAGIRAIRPAARVVYDLVEEAQDQLARLGAAEE